MRAKNGMEKAVYVEMGKIAGPTVSMCGVANAFEELTI